ncbi:MAG: hypothetical protein ABSA46_19410 [Thermodesulfovibrionales bacterium]|jgi:hypothetical protein
MSKTCRGLKQASVVGSPQTKTFGAIGKSQRQVVIAAIALPFCPSPLLIPEEEGVFGPSFRSDPSVEAGVGQMLVNPGVLWN